MHEIIQERYADCKKLLTENKDKVEKLAEALLAREVLNLPEIIELVGPKPFEMSDNLKKYLEELTERMEQETEEQALKEAEYKAKDDEQTKSVAYDDNSEDESEKKE